MKPVGPRSTLLGFGRLAVTAALVIGLYYLVPVEPGVSGGRLAVRVLAAVVLGGMITLLIIRQISRHLAGPEQASMLGLLTALLGGVVFFALADYVITHRAARTRRRSSGKARRSATASSPRWRRAPMPRSRRQSSRRADRWASARASRARRRAGQLAVWSSRGDLCCAVSAETTARSGRWLSTR